MRRPVLCRLWFRGLGRRRAAHLGHEGDKGRVGADGVEVLVLVDGVAVEAASLARPLAKAIDRRRDIATAREQASFFVQSLNDQREHSGIIAGSKPFYQVVIDCNFISRSIQLMQRYSLVKQRTGDMITKFRMIIRAEFIKNLVKCLNCFINFTQLP